MVYTGRIKREKIKEKRKKFIWTKSGTFIFGPQWKAVHEEGEVKKKARQQAAWSFLWEEIKLSLLTGIGPDTLFHLEVFFPPVHWFGSHVPDLAGLMLVALVKESDLSFGLVLCA